MDVIQMMGIGLSAILAENFVLVYCVGMGTNPKVFVDPREGRRTGIALTLVMVVAGVLSRYIDDILMTFNLEYLQLIFFTLLVISVSAVLGVGMKFFLPELSHRLAEPIRNAFGNAAVLGIILMASMRGYTVAQTAIYCLCGGIGITLVLMCFAGLREEISLERCPKAFRGMPILLITGGLMALAMVGFYGLNIR